MLHQANGTLELRHAVVETREEGPTLPSGQGLVVLMAMVIGRPRAFFGRIKAKAEAAGLLSDEHFTVDGTLIEAWASLKSFRPKVAPPLTAEGRLLILYTNFFSKSPLIIVLTTRHLKTIILLIR